MLKTVRAMPIKPNVETFFLYLIRATSQDVWRRKGCSFPGRHTMHCSKNLKQSNIHTLIAGAWYSTGIYHNSPARKTYPTSRSKFTFYRTPYDMIMDLSLHSIWEKNNVCLALCCQCPNGQSELCRVYCLYCLCARSVSCAIRTS